MTQLTLDVGGYNFALPESIKGGYSAYETQLTVDLEMILGNVVKELRGNVWEIDYQYGYFGDDDRNKFLEICKKGTYNPIICTFEPPKSAKKQITSEFFVTNYSSPRFMWSADGNPLWGDFSLHLREVEPHD